MSARTDAIRTAQNWLAHKPIFIDTETTGLNDQDEICDLAVIDYEGAVLLNSLVRPTIPISAAARAVHHINDAMVKTAPTLADLWGQVRELLLERLVVIYNLDYDWPRLIQSAQANKVETRWLRQAVNSAPGWHCAMKLYAQFYGRRGSYGGYRWQKLEQAARQCGLRLPASLHRACADAELTRQVVRHMADTEKF